jgi:hypothetical protein
MHALPDILRVFGSKHESPRHMAGARLKGRLTNVVLNPLIAFMDHWRLLRPGCANPANGGGTYYDQRRRRSGVNNYAEILRGLLRRPCEIIDTLRRP